MKCSINFASDVLRGQLLRDSGSVAGAPPSKFDMSQLKIREMPQDERPREKLLARGPDALTNPELIAILLRTGRRGMNVIEVARELLKNTSPSRS